MYRNKIVAFILSISLSQSSFCQMLNISPYTRYGLGELMNTATAPFSKSCSAKTFPSKFSPDNAKKTSPDFKVRLSIEIEEKSNVGP